jgi:hypothetical protein
MIRLTCMAIALACGVATAQATPLITPTEAALPPASGAMVTRGITRGPAVKLVSPQTDQAVKGPFDWKVQFEARGGEKIDPSSVKVTYVKSPFVDLTPRIQSAISAEGINFQKAEVPPGEHVLRITVKDSAGRETNSTMTLKVEK